MSLYANQTVSYFHVHRFNDCFINRSSAGIKNQITLAAYFRFRSHYSFVQKIFNFHSFGGIAMEKKLFVELVSQPCCYCDCGLTAGVCCRFRL
jgi:hypothetical protein